MKRTIRLNESDLARIVEGTAKKMLNELDWKTYANAAKKSYDRYGKGGYRDRVENERASAFNRAAEEAFNRDYFQGDYKGSGLWWRNYEDEPYTGRKDILRGDHSMFMRVDPIRNRYVVGMSSPNREFGYSWDSGRPEPGGLAEFPDGRYNFNTPENAERNMRYVYKGTPMLDRFDRTRNEMEDYFDDRYRYEKGRGWTK